MPKKTHEERVEIRQRVEAARNPDKDRTGHDGARGEGAKMQSLRDLSREFPTKDESKAILAHLEEESDRGLALLSGAIAEMGLFWAIYARFPNLGEKVRKATFEDSGAPLASFSAKITIGRAMGIFGPDTEQRLHQIRLIRNAFAHAVRPLDFIHPTIEAECAKLNIPPELENFGPFKSTRHRFGIFANAMYALLLHDAREYGIRNIETRLP